METLYIKFHAWAQDNRQLLKRHWQPTHEALASSSQHQWSINISVKSSPQHKCRLGDAEQSCQRGDGKWRGQYRHFPSHSSPFYPVNKRRDWTAKCLQTLCLLPSSYQILYFEMGHKQRKEENQLRNGWTARDSFEGAIFRVEAMLTYKQHKETCLDQGTRSSSQGWNISECSMFWEGFQSVAEGIGVGVKTDEKHSSFKNKNCMV